MDDEQLISYKGKITADNYVSFRDRYFGSVCLSAGTVARFIKMLIHLKIVKVY